MSIWVRRWMLRRFNNSGAGGTVSPIFSALLQSSLVPEVATGSSTPTFTRATTAYVQDWEGLLKPVLSGESRLTGARRVQNYVLLSENLGGANWAGDAVATSATLLTNFNGVGFSRRYYGVTIPSSTKGLMRAKVKAGTATFLRVALNNSGDAGITMNLSTGAITNTYNAGSFTITSYGVSSAVDSNGYWTVFLSGTEAATASCNPLFAIVDSGAAGNNYSYTGAGNLTAYITQVQYEVSDGQSVQIPSEYVSVGVAPYNSAPFYGAGVAAVKNFTTLNGNTVSSNVVTEATGAAITSSNSSALTTDASGPFGYLSESAATNLALQSQTFDNATWIKAAVTVTADQYVAPDSTTTVDKVLVSVGSNIHQMYQAVTLTAAVHSLSLTLKYVNHRWAVVLLQDNSAVQYAVSVDLLNGVIGSTLNVGTSGKVTATNQAGVYKVTFTTASAIPAGASYVVVAANNTDATTQQTWNAAGTEIIGLWGYQCEVGTVATSYIPTTTVAVTRNADVDQYVSASNTSATTMTIPLDWFPEGAASMGSNQMLWGSYVDASNYTVIRAVTTTNTCKQSQTFNSATWTKSAGAVTADATTAPDGTSTADLFTPTATSAFHYMYGTGSGTNAAGTQSYYVKPNGYTKLGMRNGSTGGFTAAFNCSGAGTVLYGAGIEYVSASITALANGWYRIQTQSTALAGQSLEVWVINPSYTTGDFVVNWTPDGTSGVYVWGAQIETASNATPYVATVAAAVTASSIEVVKRIAAVNYSAWANLAYAANTKYHIVCRVDQVNGVDVWVDGTKGIGSTYVSAGAQLGANFQIGADGNSLNQAQGSVRAFKIYNSTITDAQAALL